jgi:hypothetical protein
MKELERELREQAESKTLELSEISKSLHEKSSELDLMRAQLTKARNEFQMATSFTQLNQSMLDMKNKEIVVCKEAFE